MGGWFTLVPELPEVWRSVQHCLTLVNMCSPVAHIGLDAYVGYVYLRDTTLLVFFA